MAAKAKKKEAKNTPSAERRSPRQQRSQATVEAILAATARVLVSDGYAGINTNRIAEAAEISVGSLYQYFKNKDEVIAALIEQQCELITEKIQTHLIRLASEPLHKIVRGLVETFFDIQRADSGFFRVVREEIPRKGLGVRIGQVHNDLIDLLGLGISLRRPGLSSAEAKMVAFIIVHAIDGITDAALREGLIGSDYERLLEETTSVVMSYLGTKADRKEPKPSPAEG